MLKRLWLFLLLALFFAPQVSYASEVAEPTYQITESELIRLEQNLNELQILNNSQSMTLEKQKEQLQTSDLQLRLAETKYMLLSSQMKNLEKEMLEQQNSLEAAQKYFEEFEKEERQKRDKLKRERTVAWTIAGVLLCACISK